MRRAIIICILFLCFYSQSALAQFRDNEPLLMPGGLSTADTLRGGEWLLAPIPWGWVAYGASSKLTVAWDYPITLMGYPAGFIRFRPIDSKRSRLALEVYGIAFKKKGLNDDRSKGYQIEHRGAQSWARLESSTSLSETVDVHLYAGGNYAEYTRYYPKENGDRFPETVYKNHWTPDAGVGLSWSVKPKTKIHLNYVYGNTFLFVDQVPRKQMVVGQLHFAPFGPHRSAFLRNMRFDLSAMYVRVPDANNYKESVPLPVYPTLYWQWGGNK